MTAKGLGFINQKLCEAGINYSFQEWTGNVIYPYFVGEYIQSSADGENGEAQCRFIITGTTNGTWLSLEREKEKLREIFPESGTSAVFPDGSAIAVFYSDSVCIPTGTADYKRIQTGFIVKEWRVK